MILITGATGNVGSELVLQLLDQGQQVRVLTRDARKVAHFGSRVEVAIGDFDHRETLTAAMERTQDLFLMSSEIGSHHVAAATEAAKQTGVQHIVYLSSVGAQLPDTAIGKWHLDREEHVKASGASWTILRPGGFMSNALQWAGSIKAQGTVYSPGQGTSTPIDPADIAAVAAHALTGTGLERKTYDLTGPEVLTAADQVRTLSGFLDKPIRLIEVPISAAREGMRRGGLPPVLVDAILELTEKVSAAGTVFQTDTVAQLLGRAPRTFAQWCQTHIDSFR